MDRPYLLPRERDPIAVGTLRHHGHAPALKISDPATRAMTDFKHDAVLTVTEDLALQEVLDEMFRFGVRAFLVVRERVVTGLITTEHARAEHRAIRSGSLRVVDVMTPSAQVPAIDWQVLQEAQVRDLVEIFEGSGAAHLVVLENESPLVASVRGLIHRERLERQLSGRWGGADAPGDLSPRA